MPDHKKVEYDIFIGRNIDRDGEYFLVLNLRNHDFACYRNLNDIFDVLCYNIKNEKKILLSELPKFITRKNISFFKKFSNYLEKVTMRETLEDFILNSNFQPLNSIQLKKLERLYELNKGMKLLPNPFLHQPKQEWLRY